MENQSKLAKQPYIAKILFKVLCFFTVRKSNKKLLEKLDLRTSKKEMNKVKFKCTLSIRGLKLSYIRGPHFDKKIARGPH